MDDVNPLPRSVVRRTPFLLLDGEWRFALDLENLGLTQSWHVSREFVKTAVFPASIESQIVAARENVDFDSQSHNGLIAWYEREFLIPAEWNDFSDSLTQLTFGACGYETRARLNGSALKTVEGEECHLGEYNLFSLD